MYATSLRYLARTRGRNGASHSSSRTWRRFLSSHGTLLTAYPQRRTPRQHHPATIPTIPTIPTTRLILPLQPGIPLDSRRQPTRHYAVDSSEHPPKSIAILGGGLTGLSTAWHLTRVLPKAKITIYEAQTRMGGWIETDKVEVKTPDGGVGTVHFERAARMIKPQTEDKRVPKWDDLLFFEMVTELNLTDQLMHLKKAEESVAGYIYYPDRLVAIPKASKTMLRDMFGSVSGLVKTFTMLAQPLFRDLIPSCFHILRNKDNPYQKDMFEGRSDMSIGDFFSHSFGRPGLVDKVLSGMIHGITGGDVWKLSMGSGFLADHTMPNNIRRIGCSPVRTADFEMMVALLKNKAVFDLASQHLDTSALWFRDGFSTLPKALAAALEKNPIVTIRTGTPVRLVDYREDVDKVAIHTKNTTSEPAMYDKVVSTIFAKTLSEITQNHLPSLASSTAVNIMVVNIWYPVPQANFPHNGFGYLLPQALSFDQNPECVLGVIFDSDRESPLPTASNPDPGYRGADTVPGTKLTVMMGGHYWDGWPSSAMEDTKRAEEDALAAVARHLNLPPELTAQAHASAKLRRECIPQHLVGHRGRMQAAHAELEWAFKGRLAVAGQSYQSPGVLPMLRAGRDVARQIAGREGRVTKGWSVGDTGLQRFEQPNLLSLYTPMPRGMMPLRSGSGAYMDDNGKLRSRDGLSLEDVVKEAREWQERKERGDR
ncbi:uncharacterized protein B0H64DRAFT_380544 [Chaetomium fimeti]|uniref:protoporphyrinogen oxidase n=1 Tax=Chaetomium fimeti TaxID=1854472 RepID=A0AAE0LWI9_9PEZI|nr:hypothetical protein B0H64DRAFT_380544 [Chaetomium fimeti]